MNRFQATAACITLFVNACASSPPVQFYTLDALPHGAGEKIAAVSIGLGPIIFPDYLKRPQIVTRTGGQQINIAEFHRWAEPLEQTFVRVLANNMDEMLEAAVVVAFPNTMNQSIDMRVVGDVFRFDTDADGLAVLDVQWAAGDSKQKKLVAPRRVRYEARAGNPQDYGDVVAALNETLNSFSRDIATALGEHLQ